jgi:hypothetical protein
MAVNFMSMICRSFQKLKTVCILDEKKGKPNILTVYGGAQKTIGYLKKINSTIHCITA